MTWDSNGPPCIVYNCVRVWFEVPAVNQALKFECDIYYKLRACHFYAGESESTDIDRPKLITIRESREYSIRLDIIVLGTEYQS